jgi:hypothetical protein
VIALSDSVSSKWSDDTPLRAVGVAYNYPKEDIFHWTNSDLVLIRTSGISIAPTAQDPGEQKKT